jgi:hypothetical protein
MTGLDVFAPLDGASPWLWLTFALALGAVELVATSFFLIWVALAAAGTALALALVPGLSGEAQTALFAALSVVFTFVGRAALRRPGVARPGLNRRASALTGRRARVVGDFATGIGAVEIDGLRWRARLDGEGEGEGEGQGEGADGQAGPPAPREGDMVAILGADGVVLRVAPD